MQNPRRAYISCAYNERELEVVRSLSSFLSKSNTVSEFAPQFSKSFYRHVEDLIDGCDVFIAIVGEGYQNSTWLTHELFYADKLKKFRFNPRPGIFGVRIQGKTLPPICSDISIEWLDDPVDYEMLLEALPETESR